MEDIKIIEKCQSGDLGSFAKLYDKYIDKIYNYIYHKTFDIEVAQDITSDVFYKAMNKIGNFDIEENSNFQAWLYKIAGNHVIDYYKTNKTSQDLEEYLEMSIQHDIGQDIDNKTKLSEILEYLKDMKDEHREIVILRIWEDLSYSEISQITGKSIDNCKKIVSRSLKSIAANFLLFLIICIIL